MAKVRSTWGTIRKKGANSWEIRYFVAGNRLREIVHGSRAKAERRLSELRIKYEGVTNEVTVSEFWDNVYLPEITKQLAPSTVRGYTNKYERHILPIFGSDILRDIKPAKIQSWLLEMSHETAKHCKVVLSSMFAHALMHKVVAENVAAYPYQLPKSQERRSEKGVYTLDELNEIFELCRGEDWEAIYILAAFGGAQRSEAMGVKLEDISFIDDFAAVAIKRSVQRINGEQVIEERTKVEVRRADVIIPPPYSQRLRELAAEAEERGDVWLTDDGEGHPKCPERMAKAYERWFQHQEIKYIPFRNLRNAYSTALHKMQLEDSTISKLMRHSNLTTDYRHYNRISTEDKIELLKGARADDGPNWP